MPISITTIDEALEEQGTKILVHGRAGVGKTTMAATAGAPTLIISAESGLLSIKGAPSYIRTVQIKTMDDLSEVYEYLRDEDHGFEWVVLDSISEIGEVVLSAEKAINKDPRAAYGNLIDIMTKMLKKFRDLPMNVMMTCKQQRITDEDIGTVVYAPQLPGNRLANDLPYLFDLVLALRVEKDEEGNEYRVVQTGADIRHVAKDRSGMLDMFEPPSLKKIYDKIHPDGKVEIKKPAPPVEEVIDDEEEDEKESQDAQGIPDQN